MSESSSTNPYAPPEIAELGPKKSDSVVSFPRRSLFVVLVFAVLRGLASGFATLILLVHLSQTPIHWHNVTPLLTAALIGCAVLHYVEWEFRIPTFPALIFGLSGYLIGVTIVIVAGLRDSFPNPF